MIMISIVYLFFPLQVAVEMAAVDEVSAWYGY